LKLDEVIGTGYDRCCLADSIHLYPLPHIVGSKLHYLKEWRVHIAGKALTWFIHNYFSFLNK
jgi:hypothetical protein